MKVLMKKTYFSSSIDEFYNRISDINDVVRAGEAIAVTIHGGEEGEDLNALRNQSNKTLQ